MSEEEIMDNIKDFLQLEEIHSNNNAIKSFLSIYQEAIQGLLDLYNKEKDKINSKIEEYEEILQSSIIKEDYKLEVQHIIGVLKELRGE